MPVTFRHVSAWALALVLVAMLAGVAAADADLVSSDPIADAEVAGPFPGPILLTFDEPLSQSGSSAELLDASGTRVAEAQIPADADDEMAFVLADPLGPGVYEVRWVTTAEDTHVSRGTFKFTVLETEPTPEPTPSLTARPSDAPTAAPTPSATAAPSPSAAPSGDGTPAASTSDLLFPILAAVIAVAVLGWVLLRNRQARR